MQRTAVAVTNEKAAVSEGAESKRQLQEAIETIKVLQNTRSEKYYFQNMARLVQSQTASSDDAATSPRCNTFDDFNSDLKLQVEAGRALIASLRQELSDAQDCVAVMQKQLAREKEQV